MNTHELNFFNTIAPCWDSMEKMSLPAKIINLLEEIEIKPDQKILDLGTGTGVLLPQLARTVGPGGEITAIDLSVGMLSIAKEKFATLTPKPKFLNIDFEKENINSKYHHILLYCVYPHLETPVQTLRKLTTRNLLPDGKLTIAFPCRAEVINKIHAQNPIHSELLPEASELTQFLNNHNLPAKLVEASSELYIVTIPSIEDKK